MNPLVTCILTTYNRSSLLPRSVKSVLTQDYINIELIIVDDFSSDSTREYVSLLNDRRVRYYRHPENLGLAASRNTGLRASKGSYICFLDDDDEWLPNKISLQLNVFNTSELPCLGVVSCGIRRINGTSSSEFRETLRGNLLEKMAINQPLVGNGSCVMITREAFTKVGFFDTRYKRGIDGFYYTRLARYFLFDFYIF